MVQKNLGIIIPNKRDKSRKTRRQKLIHKAWRMGLSFLVGVAITSVVHAVLDNHKVRTTAEKVCVIFGKDVEKCKEGIDDVMNMADSVTQNNANIKEE